MSDERDLASAVVAGGLFAAADLLPTDDLTRPGARLGTFEVVERLGEGGAGIVLRARDPKLGREVAIKMLAQGEAASPALLRRFEREARALADLRHPHIVPVHALGRAGGQPFLVLDWMRGESLEARLRNGPFDVDDAVRLGLQVAAALGAAHEVGLVHRDVKPANVLLDGEGRARLTDFGLVKSLGDESARLTQTGWIVGTPGFMAPEQARGRPDEVGPATDIHGLGATLYALLTGEAPFKGNGLAEVVIATQAKAPASIRAARPEVPAWLDRVVRKCLEKDPRDRYRSMRALREALASESAPRRRPRPAIVLSALLVGLVSAALVTLTPARSARAPGERAAAAAGNAAPSETRTPPTTAELRAIGEAHLKRSEQRQALAALTEVLLRDPFDAEAHLLRGATYELSKDLQLALSDYVAAIALEPRNWIVPRAYGRIGMIQLGFRAPRAACMSLDAAILTDPNKPGLHNLRGLARKSLGDRSGAVADFTQALRLDPKNVRVLTNRGVVHYLGGDFSKAVADFTTALEVDPDAQRARYTRALANREQKRFEAAKADLDLVLRRHPDDASALLARGQVHRALGDLSTALADLTRSIELKPTGVAHQSRAVVYRAMSRHAEAAADLRAMTILDPRRARRLSPSTKAYMLQHLGKTKPR